MTTNFLNRTAKPVVFHDARKIINMDSGFKEKLLCDGPTFSCSSGCRYECCFCYVPNLMSKLPAAAEAMKALGRNFHEFELRRSEPLKKLRDQLVDGKGRPKFKTDQSDRRVIYSSPLADVAATVELAKETVEACKIILELTNWQIRLLSKSNLLPFIAERLPAEAKARVIYGVSTGTLDDKLAQAFEHGTPLVSKRIKSLHELQDGGYRTFGMICPSLPNPDYATFSKEAAEALRIDRLEHCWGEVINVRGESMTRTCASLEAAGFHDISKALRVVAEDKEAWEAYSRDTFLGHVRHIPAAKLRFLQYVNTKNIEWWRGHVANGAVLLGRNVETKTP